MYAKIIMLGTCVCREETFLDFSIEKFSRCNEMTKNICNKLSTSDPYLFHKKSQKIYCVRKCLISAYLTGPPRAFPVTLMHEYYYCCCQLSCGYDDFVVWKKRLDASYFIYLDECHALS